MALKVRVIGNTIVILSYGHTHCRTDIGVTFNIAKRVGKGRDTGGGCFDDVTTWNTILAYPFIH